MNVNCYYLLYTMVNHLYDYLLDFNVSECTEGMKAFIWGCRGIVHFEILSVGEAITAKKYCNQTPGLTNGKCVTFDHNNTRTVCWKNRPYRSLKNRNGKHSNTHSILLIWHFRIFFLCVPVSLKQLKRRKCDAVSWDENYLTNFSKKKNEILYENCINKLVERWGESLKTMETIYLTKKFFL